MGLVRVGRGFLPVLQMDRKVLLVGSVGLIVSSELTCLTRQLT